MNNKEDLNDNSKNKNLVHDSHTLNTERDSNKVLEDFSCKMNEHMNSIPNNIYIIKINYKYENIEI